MAHVARNLDRKLNLVCLCSASSEDPSKKFNSKKPQETAIPSSLGICLGRPRMSMEVTLKLCLGNWQPPAATSGQPMAAVSCQAQRREVSGHGEARGEDLGAEGQGDGGESRADLLLVTVVDLFFSEKN